MTQLMKIELMKLTVWSMMFSYHKFDLKVDFFYYHVSFLLKKKSLGAA